MNGGKKRKADGMPGIGGEEAIFQMGDGGRHDSWRRPRSQSPRHLSYFCNGTVMATAK